MSAPARWAIAVLVTLAAAPGTAHAAGDQTAFAPDCAKPQLRVSHKCLNASSIGGALLTGSSATVTDGQRLSFSVAAPPSCPKVAKVGQAPCTRVTWGRLFGASLANWGAGTRAALGLAGVSGCGADEHTCAFTVVARPGARALPSGAALRVTAVVEIDGYGCGPVFCNYGPLAPPDGGGWLDWRLRWQPSCGAAKASAAATAALAGSCPTGIGFDMEQRTSDVPHIAEGSPIGMLRPRDVYAPITVNLHLTAHGRPTTSCTRGSVWKWRVTAKPKGATVLTPPIPGCGSQMQVDESGAYTLVARRYDGGRLKQTIGPKRLQVQDLLVVAMGDSNGSGEGDPPFWFDQCDRGSASYQYQAADMLEQQTEHHVSATFVSASCSGAVSADLYRGHYDGVHPGPALAPQIAQLQRQLTPPAGKARRTVDAAIVSIGVNDLGFGPILDYCIKYQVAVRDQLVPPCEDTPVRPELDARGAVAHFVADPGGHRTLAQTIDGYVARLPGRYDAVARALASSGLVKPSRVFLTQYPSFFYDSNGRVCTSQGGPASLVFASIRASTWQWLAGEGAKLNSAVVRAAAAHGWNGVAVPRQLFYGHGYCSSDSWFVSLATAGVFNWNLAGAFHPTARGAHVTGVFVLKGLCALLADRRACATIPAP